MPRVRRAAPKKRAAPSKSKGKGKAKSPSPVPQQLSSLVAQEQRNEQPSVASPSLHAKAHGDQHGAIPFFLTRYIQMKRLTNFDPPCSDEVTTQRPEFAAADVSSISQDPAGSANDRRVEQERGKRIALYSLYKTVD